MSNKPSLAYLSSKVSLILQELILFCKSIVGSFPYKLTSVYLRGSMPRGLANEASDVDIDFFLLGKDEYLLNDLNYCLSCWYSMQPGWPTGDIKLFLVDSSIQLKHNLGPAYTNTLLHRALLFDFWANGLCVYGEKLSLDKNFFESVDEFKAVMAFLWGGDINELVIRMNTSALFNSYYALSKRIIKFCAYVNLEEKDLYHYSVEKCFLIASNYYPTHQKDLNIIYQLYTKERSAEDPLTVINSVNSIYHDIVCDKYQRSLSVIKTTNEYA